MDFSDIAKLRQSCRNFDHSKAVEKEKLDLILESSRLAPSACNGQPYFITVCEGETAKKVAKATQTMGLNGFSSDAPVQLVISEMPYTKTAAIGSKIKGNDYRSIDIGILSAYITAQATELGLDTCILGWLDSEKIKKICSVSGDIRLVISLGYKKENDAQRQKKRKSIDELIKFL